MHRLLSLLVVVGGLLLTACAAANALTQGANQSAQNLQQSVQNLNPGDWGKVSLPSTIGQHVVLPGYAYMSPGSPTINGSVRIFDGSLCQHNYLDTSCLQFHYEGPTSEPVPENLGTNGPPKDRVVVKGTLVQSGGHLQVTAETPNGIHDVIIGLTGQ